MELILPTETVIGAIQPAGPLAARFSWAIRLPVQRIHIDNLGDEPLRLRYQLVPLQDQHGQQVPAHLDVRAEDHGTNEALSIPARSSGALLLAPSKPIMLPPGEYRSRLDIRVEGSESPQSIPIRLQVRAHWGWALALLLLGLMVVGGITLVAEEGKVKKHITEVLELQESAHELAQRYATYPAAVRLRSDIDEAIQQTLMAIDRPRPTGVVDWRVERANRFEALARARVKQLQEITKQGSPGEIAWNQLTEHWQRIHRKIADLKQQSSDATLAGRATATSIWLTRLLNDTGQRITSPLIFIIEKRLAPHVERAELTLLAGEDNRAARLAEKVQHWLERAAAELRLASDIKMAVEINGLNMLRLYEQLTQSIDTENYNAGQREKLTQTLEPAMQAFASEPTLIGFRDAHAAIQAATTQVLQFRSDRLLKELRAVIDETERQVGIESITHAIPTPSPHETPEQKRQNLLFVAGLWKKWLADQPASTQLDEIGAMIQCLEYYAQDYNKDLLSKTIKELIGRWEAYHDHVMTAAQLPLFQSYCGKQKSNLAAELEASRESLRLLEPHPGLIGLEKRLDAIERQIDQVVPDRTCLEKLAGLSLRSAQVGDQLFVILLQVSDIPDQARLDSAERSGDERTSALVKHLTEEPWPIHLMSLTTGDELHAKREIIFQIDNLNPAWKQDVELKIDFGDGSKEVSDAESLRKRGLLSHRYEQPGRYTVKVEALSHDQITGQQTIDGVSELSIMASQSPVSSAERISSTFFNLRFLLAMTIASLIGTWRFASNPLFGAKKRDYLEAFVVGFSANLGVEGLASWSAKVSL